jgi:hypothetical protein
VDTKSKGLGDDIAKVAKVAKLDIIADKIAKKLGAADCGCSQRQDNLNRMFPYK